MKKNVINKRLKKYKISKNNNNKKQYNKKILYHNSN